MGPIVIYYHVIMMESDFELARQGLNEFVYLGHKGLKQNCALKYVYIEKLLI